MEKQTVWNRVRNIVGCVIKRIGKEQCKVRTNLEKIEDKIWWRMYTGLSNTEGIGVVEVILILVVLIGLVIIFKSQLTTLVGDIFDTITSESSTI